MKEFVQTCDSVAATTKKLEKVRLVAELLRTLKLEDAALAALFLTGRAFPRTEERILGLGSSNLYRLVQEITEKSDEELRALYRKHGDLGDAAEEALNRRVPRAGILLTEVAECFASISEAKGGGQKYELLKALSERASPGDVKYLVKIISGDLRIGLKESLVEDAIAQSFGRPVEQVRRANMLTGNIQEVLLLAAGDQLGSAKFALFHPIDFMLATPIEAVEELFDESPREYFVETKYDGIRAQAHKQGERVKLFSRTLSEVPEFPELADTLRSMPGTFVLDGEILGWEGSNPLPFTELQKRLGRKTGQMNLWTEGQIKARFLVFDALFLDGEVLIETSLRDRRVKLEKLFSGLTESEIQLAPYRICDNPQDLASAFRLALEAGHEGVMVKNPESFYAAGKRGGHWFKWKEAYATLDVVVTAVEYGHGRRHRVLSDYTFAVRSGDQLLTIGKAYSGLTDREIESNTEYFLAHTQEDQGHRRIVDPTMVIEVAFNNIQKSNRHDSGYALRFPRIVRLRPDKPVSEIDTLARVEQLYAKQAILQVAARQKGAAADT